jgi:hypothetical protein
MKVMLHGGKATLELPIDTVPKEAELIRPILLSAVVILLFAVRLAGPIPC